MSALKTVHRAAKVRSSSWNADERTIDVVWSTGAAVDRSDWDGDYVEILDMDPSSIRLGRLNAGAPLIDTHDSSEISRVLGFVVLGTARIEGGEGLASVRLSAAKDCADAVLKIVEGSIRNISVGYWIHKQEETEADGIRTIRVVDWEPLEISAVPIPADAGAGFRSAGERRQRSTGRAGALRRMARAAGMPDLVAEHVRAGTSPDDFFNILVGRLGGGSTRSEPMTKQDQERRDFEAGRRRAEALLGRGTKRDDDAKAPKDDDDEDGDDTSSTASNDDDDDEADTASEKAKQDDDRKRGAASVRNLSGRNVRSSAANALADIRAGRREAKRADSKRVDDAIDYEAGKRAAQALKSKGHVFGK